MTGVPPSFSPLVHAIVILAAFVWAGTFYKFTGASAAVNITAPFPTSDVSELP